MIEPDLSGRTALVTGSAKGVGRELLLSLAERGASVAVHYNTSPDAAEEVADAAREHDVEAVTVQGDVTDPSAVGELFSAVEADLGSVEILVNNVGAFAPTHWEEIDFETWNLVLETNLNGTYLCSKRALPGMRENDWGRIVNVGYASADRLLVAPKNFPYFVAKAGVIMFTRMLAADTQDTEITVNAISPYVVENSDVFPEDLPRGRAASFEDMSQAMLIFLEDGSDYLSGQNLAVDGGWRPERI
ncbi:SDR family NAD(P)-dependent oxidoreductase [Halococcus sp. IIIV-5B]|uniref:SDR family NAD(P)-dependent oxidoreductase n=1 Tax=Halococcus sp. IIIV-5B TaxID=2321230 RepID=UPI000E749C04|nr:SDR family NAD(P)-dependent oxidoreductase [Halococcus sp. IIIV-5B]RJT06866.1 SDR family oxidoreductase [Halococcus sp. IIIV-5B]